MDLLKWAFFVFVLFGVAWFLTGGRDRPQQPFLTAPTLSSPSEQYGGTRSNSTTGDTATNVESGPLSEETSTLSIFNGKVSFSGRRDTFTNDVDKEYIQIVASRRNLQPINISNWSIKSAVTGKGLQIGAGSYLPFGGRVNSEGAILLNPGDKAVIVTGRSPFGVSFRLNTCTGYLEQFQDYTPRLPLECPRAEDEDYSTGIGGLNDACLDFLESIRRCEIETNFPLGLSNECRDYVSSQLNYNACVSNHRDEPDFLKAEWRIFLKRSDDLWKTKRETILLIDETGRTVDSLTY